MRSALLLLLANFAPANSLYLPSPKLYHVKKSGVVVRAAPAVMQFSKKDKKPTLEELGYWPGEWVCADCGYIYEPGTEPPFEELRTFWKCPQCAGPRRRFVKKAGNMVGVVNDNSLYVGTAFAALAVVALVYVGLTF